jgi:hypothetical protein
VATFLRLKSLLLGLQAELDLSWAVLGEVYGRNEKLRQLTLVLRRVKSNLDKVPAYLATLGYYPVRAAFGAAGAELLSLLVSPLYGDNPNFGVRELLQNAIDACRERDDIIAQGGKNPKTLDDEIDVEISIEGDDKSGYEFTIRDRGVGMTADTVVNYFLRAGASFRGSDLWKSTHQTESGHSRVLRSGRFGIGALAAFLLGDSIRVKTRQINAKEEEGVAFTANLSDELIELHQCNHEVGTSITVPLRFDSAEGLIRQAKQSWNSFGEFPLKQYLLSRPLLRVTVLNKDIPLKPDWPAQSDPLPEGRRSFAANGFEAVKWTYNEEDIGQVGCNGIAVCDDLNWRGSENRFSLESWESDCGGVEMKVPAVSVFDPDGRLPLVLTRDRLATFRFPFQSELIDEICVDIVADVLFDPAPGDWFAGKLKYLPRSGHPAIYEMPGYLFSSSGFTVPDRWTVRRTNAKKLTMAFCDDFQSPVSVGEALLSLPSRWSSISSRDDFVRTHIDGIPEWNMYHSEICFAVGTTTSNPRYRGLKRSQGGQGWDLFMPLSPHLGKSNPTAIDLKVVDGVSQAQPWAVAVCELKSEQPDVEITPLGKAFMMHLGTCVVPYSVTERRLKFPEAFEKLADRVHKKKEKKRKTEIEA